MKCDSHAYRSHNVYTKKVPNIVTVLQVTVIDSHGIKSGKPYTCIYREMIICCNEEPSSRVGDVCTGKHPGSLQWQGRQVTQKSHSVLAATCRSHHIAVPDLQACVKEAAEAACEN
jgi:hypothetical protein